MAAGVKYFQLSMNFLCKCIQNNHKTNILLNAHGTQYVFTRKYARKFAYRRPQKVIMPDGQEVRPDTRVTDEVENLKSQQIYNRNKTPNERTAEKNTDIPHYIKLGDDSKAFT